MRTKRFLAGTAAGAVALSVAGGCAAQQIRSLEPKLELRTAAQHLADARQAGFTLKLTGSADDLIKALEVPAGEADVVRTLFSSSVTIAYDEQRARLAATVGDVTGTEIRFVDGTVYAKAPMAELAEKFGGDLETVRREAVTEVPALGTFFDGGWIAVDAKEAAQGAYGLSEEDLDAKKALTELRAGASNLLEGAEVVRDPADRGHLTVTSSTTKAYAEVKRLMSTVGGPLGEELGAAPPDRPIVLDLWVADGKLTAAEVNVLQFVDGATGRAAVRLEVSTGEPITAPEGANRIDPVVLGSTGVSLAGGAVEEAEALGFEAMMLAGTQGGKPAGHLAALAEDAEASAKIVRRGVAQVVVGGKAACVTVPDSVGGEPKVVAGEC
jgi:hypothetical protein